MTAPTPTPQPGTWRCPCGGTSIGNVVVVTSLASCCGKQLRPE